MKWVTREKPDCFVPRKTELPVRGSSGNLLTRTQKFFMYLASKCWKSQNAKELSPSMPLTLNTIIARENVRLKC